MYSPHKESKFSARVLCELNHLNSEWVCSVQVKNFPIDTQRQQKENALLAERVKSKIILNKHACSSFK